MYEKQFGLSRRPFRATATGAEVFVGPQTAKLMGGMKKAFAATEAVVVVTGEAGVGKSTLVTRVIDAIAGEKLMIHVSRMQLGHDEVPEFLLDKLGADDIPASTIKKINLCRDLLAALASSGTRVFILIEDAGRLGEDALAEFEALTAPDTGFAEGANLVLMGDESVAQQLKSTALVRLQQRTRMRHSVPPLAAGEMLGYLKHCFRLAGGEFEQIFADGTGQALFDLSKGNPRVVNNLVDSLLSAAAEKNVSKIDRAMVAKVAGEDFALSADGTLAESAPEPADESAPAVSQAPADDEIPKLIQDTQPELAVVEAAEVAAEPAAAAENPPDWDKDPTMAELKPDIEALEQAMADLEATEDEPEKEKESEPVPEVELKDPTLPGVPELTLDTSIDDTVSEAQEALEQTNAEIEANAAPAQPLANGADQPKVGVPPLVSPAPAAPQPKADAEMMKIAAGLARAKSIEDVDDKMAETLFGEELNLAAAELMAARPEPANQDLALEADAAPAAAAPAPAPAATPAAAPAATPAAAPAATPAAAPAAAPAAPPAAAPAVAPTAAPTQRQAKKPFDENAVEVSAAVQTSGGLDLSASQRLATVRALNTRNTGKVAAVGTPPTPPPTNPAAPVAAAPSAPAANSGEPASIEDQINTEMTQTFQALNSRPSSSNDADDDSTKTGFFSRFKKS